MSEFERSALLLGEDSLEKLKHSRVAVFGVGGVGGYVVEALARSGIGSFLLIDNDKVSESNINRQIIALHSTIGKYKVDVFKERILDINPAAHVDVCKCFYLPENADEVDLSDCDYIVDAVDTITAKLEIIMRAKESGTGVISSMGAGNKLDPTKFEVADIYATSVCPLAKVIRHELKKRGVERLKVVYSKEVPVQGKLQVCAQAQDEGLHNLTNGEYGFAGDGSTDDVSADENKRKRFPGSVAFVPSVAGLIIASEVIKDLIKI